MADQERKEQIKQAIREAFADVPYPAGDAIAQLPLDPHDERAAEINRDFKGHHWRDLPDEVRNKHAFNYPPFTPEAQRFYLPAYLLATLDLIQSNTGELWTLDALLPPENMDRFRRHYDGYTPSQREAIRLSLEYMRDVACEGAAGYFARIALDRYWAREERELSQPVTEPSRKEQVKQAIREAFADVPYPGDERIAYNEQGLFDLEAIEITEDFRGYHWTEVNRAVLGYCLSALSFFSAEARQFYLPAYLLAALDCHDGIRDSVLFNLGPSEGDLADWRESRDARLTPIQKAAVRCFLEYIRDTSERDSIMRQDARIALCCYWGRAEHGVLGGIPKVAVDLGHKEQVQQAIREAFPVIPYPHDSYMTIPEEKLDPHAERFHGVPREVLIDKSRDLSVFHPDRLRVYLPAYLLAALEDLHDIVCRVVFALDPDDRRPDKFIACYGDFTPAQRRAVHLFLAYVRDAMPETGLGDLAEKLSARAWPRVEP